MRRTVLRARLGGQTRIPVDVRVIAATNRSPQEAVAQGRLRADLDYRLKVFTVTIAPLRDRIEDLEDLVPYFIEQINRDESKEVDGVDSGCLTAVRAYSWPGNVRELRNVFHQAVVTRGHGRLTLRDLPDEIYKVRHSEDHFVVRIASTMEQVQQELIRRTLEATSGNRSRTAEILKIPRRSLYDLLTRNGFPGRNERRSRG